MIWEAGYEVVLCDAVVETFLPEYSFGAMFEHQVAAGPDGARFAQAWLHWSAADLWPAVGDGGGACARAEQDGLVLLGAVTVARFASDMCCAGRSSGTGRRCGIYG